MAYSIPNSTAASSLATDSVQFLSQRWRDFRAAKLGEFRDLRRAQNGDDAWNERNGNTEPARHKIAELKKISVVEKQLREDKIRARVRFFLQMFPIIKPANFIGDVAFGKTGDADGKIALLADELDELCGEFKAAGCGLKFSAGGRIAAQRQDVFAAERMDFFEHRAHFVARVVDAGKMGERGQAVVALDAVNDHQRLVARAAARAVGHGAKVRAGLQQRGDVFFQKRAIALGGLGREKFKGDDRLFRRPFRRIDVPDELHWTADYGGKVGCGKQKAPSGFAGRGERF